MKYRWTDVSDIAIDLSEKYEDIDPISIRFTDLQRWVCELEHFEDDPSRCNEKILEAIQMAWIEEKE